MIDGGSEDGYDVDMISDEVLLQQAAGKCDLKFRHQNIHEGGKSTGLAVLGRQSPFRKDGLGALVDSHNNDNTESSVERRQERTR